MPEYLWALGNGKVASADYNRLTDSLSGGQVREELLDAFQQFGHKASCVPVSAELPEVYRVFFEDASREDIVLCAKGTTPGGRSNLKDEQRTQQKSKYINYAYQQRQNGALAVQIGVYQRDGQTVFCAWKLKLSTAGAETPVSKQIKISTIARAMKEGFVQQDKGGGEYACAFRKEFIFFYIQNAGWLHGVPFKELARYDTGEAAKPVTYFTGLDSEYPLNRILFGAPGTGKSYTLDMEKDALLAGGGEYERVTFHPDYSYANFVGVYKPVPCEDSDGEEVITYSYVPGPFMRTYVKALKNARTGRPKPFLLIIEEINRANVAAVFGDVFQLLDRGGNGISEYPVQASEDIKRYLCRELGGSPENYAEIRIPDNMFLWATMNSADQGVFPMDTAFKRRWDFTYLGIDDSEGGIAGREVVLGQGEHRRTVEWNALRKAINGELIRYGVNEDKLMGPYFISKKDLPEGDPMDSAAFSRLFKNKVIMYLFDDAAKQKRPTLFGGCGETDRTQYSKICGAFDTLGVDIFCESIQEKFLKQPPGDDAT